MRKPIARQTLQILLAAIMALALPFQAFAYKPAIITQNLPEAVTDSFYYAQLFASGFGKNAVWKAEGLPEGLRLEPGTGVISGTAKTPGMFEILVTVQNGRKRGVQTDARLFRLIVLPQTAAEPPVQSAPPLPDLPQADTDTPPLSPAPAALPLEYVEWRGIRANGEPKLETTTELYLYFSQDIWELYEGNIGIKDNAASIVSLSESGATRVLRIADIDESLKDGDEIEVVIGGFMFTELSEDSMPVALNIASEDFIKAKLDSDAITYGLILGENESAEDVTLDLSLPVAGPVYGCGVSWQSSDSETVSGLGVVTRPEHNEGNKTVTLTATVRCGEESIEKSFSVTVTARPKAVPEPPPEPDPEPEDPPDPDPEPENPPDPDPEPENPPDPDPEPENPPDPETSDPEPNVPTGSENPPETDPERPPEVVPNTPPRKTGSAGNAVSQSPKTGTSSNVDKNGSVSRLAVINELKAAMRDTEGRSAVIRAQNAQSISPKTLKSLAAAAQENGKQAVIYADTLTQRGGVDARLYLKPASLLEAAQELKLGIATRGARPEKIEKFFEKYFDNEVFVISCEQRGDFGAKLQIAAKIKLPEDTGNLVFYSYDSESNSFSRIITAYRIDANGYLRFATQKAGDIIISRGALKSKGLAS